MSFEVRKPGLFTTLQDAGRYGYRKDGVITSGPMDGFAHRTANLLVGNAANTAALEMTLQGAILYARKDMLLALCGAEMEAEIDGEKVPMWRPFLIRSGSQLSIHYAVKGCRSYLAVAGGFDVETVLGSRSTYLRAGLGGYEGRAIRTGDILEAGAAEPNLARMLRAMGSLSILANINETLIAPCFVSPAIHPDYQENPVVRIIRGREAVKFSDESVQRFFQESYTVTPQSDRMGYRLDGVKLELRDSADSEMISEAVVPGTIQVPPGGQPIVLMSDCQTTGGYPRIGQVIHADLPLVAQVRPGGQLRFQEISLREAQELLLLQEMDLRRLQAGLKAWARDRG
ncbi:5-oxoprolinase subunit C family protein [Paenibacillus sedimenti]|uniref:Biotin-dependent carboxyltransferase n=1 Tax=Paenibacillus sedimenti TaxID=2770274 RepID=A0A926KLI2_9BACL|nr:biotin-dependent carboxyltransferase family protein [Paenibacillus sedimenti]MBD0380027.1 biotin-dependent carboxyltransferase [Paenibacillus sedimenti]